MTDVTEPVGRRVEKKYKTIEVLIICLAVVPTDRHLSPLIELIPLSFFRFRFFANTQPEKDETAPFLPTEQKAGQQPSFHFIATSRSHHNYFSHYDNFERVQGSSFGPRVGPETTTRFG